MTASGTQPVTAPGWTGKPRQDIAIVDCDVHHGVKKPTDLFPYLPRLYRERVTDQGFSQPQLGAPPVGYFNVPKRAQRTDLAYLSEGGDANKYEATRRNYDTDYDLLREQHLDLWNVDCAVMTGSNMIGASGIPDPDYAAALCSAFNDWTLEHWIARDERLKMTLALSTSDPRLAVREIDRLGAHPAVVGIMLPSGTRLPYGNRFYDPIWEACERHRVAVFVHPGGSGAAPTAAGQATYYLEIRLARPQVAMAHCASLICEGTFEKFPLLRFAFIEEDQFWVPGLMWHMDADWKSLREQTPWVKHLPSEYFRKHIRIGSQPFEEPARREHLVAMLEGMHAEETLVYCSDWPHWDWDDPATTFPKLPEQLHKRIFSENAREIFPPGKLRFGGDQGG
jgi:hypothetical protein